MPGQQGSFTGAVAGLSLRAWAVFDGASGTLIKGANVTSITRNAAGNYTLNLTAAMADTNFIVDVRVRWSTSQNANSMANWSNQGATSTVAVPVQTYQAGVMADYATVYVAVYG